jgi:hypothetical protein
MVRLRSPQEPRLTKRIYEMACIHFPARPWKRYDNLRMNRLAQLTAEVQILGTLCNREDPRDVRAALVHVLQRYAFLEPEHQIVFESIRALLLRDRLSKDRLAVHLNNRGFPDVDLEKYCAAAFSTIEEALNLARRLCSLADEPSASVGRDNQGKLKHDS